MKPIDSDRPASGRPTAKGTGIRDVAEKAGVSTATVSRALNNPASVSAELRGRIAAVIEDLGYIPDASARALTVRRTRTIGAIIPTIDNAMFAQGLQALQSYLASKDYLFLLATSDYDLDVELKQARNLVSRGIDGLILRGSRHHPDLDRLLAAQALPYVNIGVYEPEGTAASIGPDNAAAGRAVTRYRIDLGHRAIGIVAARQLNNDRAQARIRGVREAMAERDLAVRDDWYVEVAYRLDEAREAARLLLARPDRPTAIVCGNDVLAYGVLLEAGNLGCSVPRDLSVVGFDDLEWSRHFRPSLTTIHLSTDEVWRAAGEYLVATLAGAAPVRHRQIDFRLVVRESTAPPAGTPYPSPSSA